MTHHIGGGLVWPEGNFGSQPPRGATGDTNGTTPVEMVPAAPTQGRQVIQAISVRNADTVSATVIITVGGDEVGKFVLAVGDVLQGFGGAVLEGSDTMTVKLSGAVTTTELVWYASWGTY